MIDGFKIWRFGSRVRQMRFRSSASYENILCKVYETEIFLKILLRLLRVLLWHNSTHVIALPSN
jgi:hypothetical protein